MIDLDTLLNIYNYLSIYILTVSGLVWFQERIPKRYMFEEFGMRVENMMTILVSIVNIIGEGAI